MPSHPNNENDGLLRLEPVPTLLTRLRAELSADFGAGRPVRVSRAPGRLDVMGGIADYTGSMVCEYPLDRAAAVAVTPRDDRDLQVFSFNLLDEHKPFTLRIPLDALAAATDELRLRADFDAPGRKWAAYLVGCLAVLHEHDMIDLRALDRGMNVAVYSTVPPGAGVSSSAAIEVATLTGLADHLGVPRPMPPLTSRGEKKGFASPMILAGLCQEVENQIVGAPCGIMDQVTSCLAEAGKLFRMVCQPHEVLPPLALPPGVRVVGINSNVKHSVGAGQYGRTRCAAFMAHELIFQKMAEMGAAAGRPLERDPMSRYLANLDADDYKQFFRPYLPERMSGAVFLKRYGHTVDRVTEVEPDVDYAVRGAADHHVLEARRVRNFVDAIERAGAEPPRSREQGKWLDRAGHLMYASHLSYTNDAMLGAPECDLLVKLVRDREPAGLYGAKITGGGSGGTVAILADEGDRAGAALSEIMDGYRRESGGEPELFDGTSPGAWHVGTALTTL
jgi:L-arabinokinase